MCTPTSQLDLVVRVGPKVDDQLRYTLRSLTAHLPHARVITAGYRAPWTTCEHLDVPPVSGKFGHAFAVLQAILDADWLTESVVIADDDMYLMRPLETLPEYHRGPLADITPPRFRLTGWTDTLDAVPDALCRDLHVPTVVDRALLGKQLDALDLPHDRRSRVWWRTLHGGGCTRAEDAKVRDHRVPAEALWLSSSDQSWKAGVGRHVRAAFGEACGAER